MSLFSYTVHYDDGTAPNPYWGVLTLAISKPVIRRIAKVGSCIVGTGSKNSPLGNIQKSIVYVMFVTEKMTLQEYDAFCRKELKNKIPDIDSEDLRRHVGDCIYDFSWDPKGKLRPSVHTIKNKETDIGGKYVLLSKEFFYFGNKPLTLPQEFQKIIKQKHGHLSKSNEVVEEEFVEWIYSLDIEENKLIDQPQTILDLSENKDHIKKKSSISCKMDRKDEREYAREFC